MSKRYIGNAELINDIQRSHILAEAFVIEAIARYALDVRELPSGAWGENPIVSLELWKEIASEALSRIENRDQG